MQLLVYSPLSLRFGGGFEHWLIEVTKRLKKYGVHTSLICTNSTVGDNSRFSYSTMTDITYSTFQNYSELPSLHFSLDGFNSTIPNLSGLRRLLSSSDYDIMYFSNGYFLQDFIVSFLKSFHKKPIISGHHAVLFQNAFLHDFYTQSISKNLLKNFDAFHVLNSHDFKILKSWNLNDVYQIPTGVDTQKFRPCLNKEKGDKFKVLFVGRLVPQKGLDILIRSIDLLNQECSKFNPGIEFVIVGTGVLEYLVKKLEKKHNNITHLREAPDELLPIIYRECDLFVFPSRIETFGIVVLEAQASGLPVIASDIPGPQDIITDKITGTLINQSSESLANSIKNYYNIWSNDYETYKQICVNSRESALKRFCWDQITKNMFEMLVRTRSFANDKS